MCAGHGDGAPYDIYTLLSLDELNVQGGGGTLDACLVFDTDDDALTSMAVCVTLRSSGPDNENRPYLSEIRLFSCEDTKVDRCMNSDLIAGPYSTTCELSFPDNDPFSPAAPDGPGSHYPWDSQIVCAIDYADFGDPARMRLLDGCSYPSSTPNSEASDCIGFSTCSVAADCDDGNACTIDVCEPSGFCIHPVDTAASCTDGLFCNGPEFCNDMGFCESTGVPVDCDDQTACTIDVCDELVDACVHDPRNSICDDGAFCNGVEICDPDAGCVAGVPEDCADAVGCTVDACDEANDGCIHTPSDAACDDGAWCTGVETCDPDAGCTAGPPPECQDSVECTVDTCDEATDACLHAPDGASCDDGLFCNGSEVCDPAAGCGPGLPPDCNDGVDCTDDACSEAADRCLNTPDHEACDDGSWCNGVEVCTPAGCEPGEEPCDAPATCDETNDQCVGCVTDADCDNGVFCDGAETCNAATGACSVGTPVNCNDGVACTIDACDETIDACTHAAADSACSDGLFCNGVETCDPVAGCQAADAPPCDDDIACTVDSCNEATDRCSRVPDHSMCDDGLYCNGEEICITGYGCEDGEPVACQPDAYECSTESCDEAADACESDFSRCVCGDREIVPGEECEPPTPAGTFEDCNNKMDDDGDGMTDCRDSDCKAGSPRGTVCDENCRIDRLCKRIGSDPAVIKFNHEGGLDSLSMHGHFDVGSMPDPTSEGFEIVVSNGTQPIYVASLGVGDLEGNLAEGTQFCFRDREAKTLGQASSRGGLGKVSLRYRTLNGVPVLAFRVQAYGDFSAATERLMSSQLTVGVEVGGLTTEWTAARRRWILRQRDF